MFHANKKLGELVLLVFRCISHLTQHRSQSSPTAAQNVDLAIRASGISTRILTDIGMAQPQELQRITLLKIII
ncbi:hypothetical protein CY34DRAFT_809437, partial [Suillus luteus UH-Slu-Lm8-n1]